MVRTSSAQHIRICTKLLLVGAFNSHSIHAMANVFRNVGPFRYWTLSNVPLFLLATPMLAIMVVSGAWALDYKRIHTTEGTKVKKHSPTARDAEADNFYIFRNLAVAQLLLALLTFITAHVQIITRISSACPVWVWYLAMRSGKGDSALAKNTLRFMVMYSMIQGVLFSSFLPPA